MSFVYLLEDLGLLVRALLACLHRQAHPDLRCGDGRLRDRVECLAEDSQLLLLVDSLVGGWVGLLARLLCGHTFTTAGKSGKCQ